MNKLTKLTGIIIVIFVFIQFIPISIENPEFDVEYDFNAPVEVREIVVNSCFDCHSNQTNWPWYSYLAPMAWLVTNHVNEGREHLNFSKWLKYPEENILKIKSEMIEEIEDGEMPLSSYLITHSNAEITDEKLLILKSWAFAQADSI